MAPATLERTVKISALRISDSSDTDILSQFDRTWDGLIGILESGYDSVKPNEYVTGINHTNTVSFGQTGQGGDLQLEVLKLGAFYVMSVQVTVKGAPENGPTVLKLQKALQALKSGTYEGVYKCNI